MNGEIKNLPAILSEMPSQNCTKSSLSLCAVKPSRSQSRGAADTWEAVGVKSQLSRGLIFFLMSSTLLTFSFF
jgi:hypothetical protein